MVRWWVIVAVLLGGMCQTVAAQETGGFVILQRMDTVAVEQFSREDVTLTGSLRRSSGGTAIDRVHYQAVLVDNQSAPLIELSAWRGQDPENGPVRQTVRVIFKNDSVAVDDATKEGGVITRVLPTVPGAVPYLNLSVAFLELATRRAAGVRRDTLAIPFFNLGGGQTVTGSVQRLGTDSATVRIGTVEFRLRVDPTGRILDGAVPAQGLLIRRTAGA